MSVGSCFQSVTSTVVPSERCWRKVFSSGAKTDANPHQLPFCRRKTLKAASVRNCRQLWLSGPQRHEAHEYGNFWMSVPDTHLGPLMRVITVLEAYRKHIEERAALGIVPQPLNAEQTAGLVELLKNPPAGEEAFLVDLITNRVPPGVDEAAYVKAGFLSAIAKGEAKSPLIDKKRAVELLGTMQGGYNIVTLVEPAGRRRTGTSSRRRTQAHPADVRRLPRRR